jgi:NAD-dependent deacetylase
MARASDGIASDVAALARLVRRSRRTVALTGAGISTESGIPDFRSAAGVWRGVDPMRVAHISVAREQPGRLWDFYRERLSLLRGARPNAAHEALARLERAGLLACLVTQNVDGLHAAAGSRPLEVHGSLREAECLECGRRFPMTEALRRAGGSGVPRCACGAALKPGVVLFGELLPDAAIERAYEEAGRCELLLALGSSLEVWPVAELPAGHVRIEGALGTVLPALADALGA